VTFKTPADLAELFGVEERQILEWRRQKSWPSLKFGKTIRFTDDHVAQIVAMHSQKTKATAAATGQTARSSRRRTA
jgi:uncharacterized protein YjcR